MAVTSVLLTPWWRNRREAEHGEATGSVEPTAILNWASPTFRAFVGELGPADDDRGLLQRAHSIIAIRVRPVYAVDDAQPVSRTLARARGSCSQRLAVLEAVARSSAIATRSRALLVDSHFWYPRFRRLRFAVPDAVLLAWPEFCLDGMWVSASDLFESPGTVEMTAGFTNADGETLFDALARGAVDWDGTTSAPGACSTWDLRRRCSMTWAGSTRGTSCAPGMARRCAGRRELWPSQPSAGGLPAPPHQPGRGRDLEELAQ